MVVVKNWNQAVGRYGKRNVVAWCVLCGIAFLLFAQNTIDWDESVLSHLLPETTLDTSPTTYVGGVPGYSVFDNLWFNDGHFHYFSDVALELDMTSVTTGRDALVVHKLEELEEVIRLKPTKRFKGETMWTNTGLGGGSVPNLVSWYYHFATELLMGSTSVLSSVRSKTPASTTTTDKLADHWIIPATDWKDHYGLNEFLVKGTYGSSLVDKNDWASLQLTENDEKTWIRFDRVVVTDRGASTSDPTVSAWNKMAIHALSLPHSCTAFEPLRHSMAKHLGHRFSSAPTRLSPDKSVAGIPKVVYIDRQDTSRHIVPEDNEALVGFLRGMERDGRIRFLHGKFGEMGLADQVKSVMDADIIIGVHGNGLTHQLFMATGGVVVEFFPPGSFVRDYQIVAEALSHTHYAVRNDTTYPRSEWEVHPGEQNPGQLHDGTEIPLDSKYIEGLMISIVNGMTA